MIRSPSSASATSSARRCSGGMQHRLDLTLGVTVDQGGLARERADLGEELARPLFDNRRHMAKAVMLGDGDMAREERRTSRRRLAGLEQRVAVAVAAERRRIAGAARSRAA